jgi:hypothetical protein
VAYLIDAALAETDLIQEGSYGYKARPLLDHNGAGQPWVLLGWSQRENGPYNVATWPEGFRKPWDGEHVMDAKEFNEQYSVGTRVRYYPIIGGREFVETETRSEAWTLPSGADVVMVKGRAGGVSLKAIEIYR